MNNFKDNIVPVLATFIIVACISFLFLAAFIDVENDQVLIAVTGTLSTVVAFYFGSSLGSSKKQDTIDDLRKNVTSDIGGSTPPPKKDEK